MNYTSVKQEINKLSQAISKQRREKVTCEQDLQTLYNEKKDSEVTFLLLRLKGSSRTGRSIQKSF